jgi:hypothetical protein
MAEYVEKLRAGVRVVQPGRDPVDGALMLSPHASYHDRPETILERLNSSDRMIPFHRDADDATLLVSRLDLEWVLARPGTPPHLVCPRTYLVTREERVLLRFRAGGSLAGMIHMELPEHLNRASDFLNLGDDFFALVTGQGVVLVNKHQVLEVELFEISPLPVESTGHTPR